MRFLDGWRLVEEDNIWSATAPISTQRARLLSRARYLSIYLARYFPLHVRSLSNALFVAKLFTLCILKGTYQRPCRSSGCHEIKRLKNFRPEPFFCAPYRFHFFFLYFFEVTEGTAPNHFSSFYPFL